VVVPGLIKEHKGVNLPDVRLNFEGLTPKDRINVRFCAENKIDYIAQSFVRTKKIFYALRDELASRRYRCGMIAKIEDRQGVQNIDEIIRVCDASWLLGVTWACHCRFTKCL